MPVDPDKPYRRVGLNSWKELLDQVNEELEDPPDGCDPIETIEVPDPDHIWAKSDIREVHDKLDEMPEDCFVWEEIPDLWKTSIIDDIEEQLPEAWCDCDPEDCCYPCENCADRTTTFLGTDSVDANDCTECTCEQDDFARCGASASMGGAHAIARSDFNQYPIWSFNLFALCLCEEELAELNEELERLEDQLERLEENLESCGDDPVCIAVTEAQIEAKEEEIEEKEEEIEEKEEECAMWEANRAEAEGRTQGACEALNAAIEEMVCCERSVFDLIEGNFPIPPAYFECPDEDNNVLGAPNPSCCGDDFWKCRTGWVLYRKGYETMSTSCNGFSLPIFEGRFNIGLGGIYDPISGAPCATNPVLRGGGCSLEHTTAFCYSAACCGNSFCGACCAHPNNDWNVDYERRLAPPGCGGGEIDCEGGPCGDDEEEGEEEVEVLI